MRAVERAGLSRERGGLGFGIVGLVGGGGQGGFAEVKLVVLGGLVMAS